MKNLQKIDILMPVGEKGGVEKVVGKTAVYLLEKGYHVRIVQLVWEHVHWAPENVEFYPLMEGRGQYTLNQFVEKYVKFLNEQGTPNLILATTWPLVVLIAKMSIMTLNHTRCKIVSWLHAPIEEYVRAGFGGMECLKTADAVFVLNKRTETMLMTSNIIKKVVLVKNPIDFTRCPMSKEWNRDARRLLYVGRVSVEKRLDVVLYALSLAKEKWYFRIIGSGEEKEKLEELVEKLSLEEQVEWLGWKENPWEYADEVTATVLSSEYESFPMTLIESLACGIPMIASLVDGIVELIEPGVNGLLYPKGNSEELARILDTISAGNIFQIHPEVCRRAVLEYEESSVLRDFEEKLMEVCDKISVIIPCYNVQNQISRCLDSIIEQNLEGVNLEIICIDDKSTDHTVEILKEYEKKYSDILILILLEENGKQGNARNIGMQYATGRYLTFVDADDFVDTNMLKSLYEKAIETQCDVVECGYMQVCNEELSAINIEKEGQTEYFDMQNIDCKRKYIIKHGWKAGPWGRLYRCDFLAENQICFLTDTFMEDIYFSELCMLYMKNYVRIPQNYYFYYENESGVMRSDKMLYYYMDTVKVQNRITQVALDRGLLEGCKEEYEYLHFSKAFVEPINRMLMDERYFSYENFLYIKESLFKLFPDFMTNSYVEGEESEIMNFYKRLLKEDWSKPKLKDMMQRWRENS